MEKEYLFFGYSVEIFVRPLLLSVKIKPHILLNHHTSTKFYVFGLPHVYTIECVGLIHNFAYHSLTFSTLFVANQLQQSAT
jgi:hypothetical protein